jgi:hypothetical protein
VSDWTDADERAYVERLQAWEDMLRAERLTARVLRWWRRG